MRPSFYKALESMTQGLAYWMAYKLETSTIKVIEAMAVAEAANILSSKLHEYTIIGQVPYKDICSCIKNNNRVDLCIKDIKTGNVVCAIEFKMSDSCNGGYKVDVQRLTEIKKCASNIECYVIIVYQKPHSQKTYNQFLKGAVASRAKIDVNGQFIKVRRVCNAIGSLTPNKFLRCIRIEVI